MCALARNLHVAQRLKAERRWDRYTAIAAGGGFRQLAGQPPRGARRRRHRPGRRAPGRARSACACACCAAGPSCPSRAPRPSSGPRRRCTRCSAGPTSSSSPTPLTPETQHLIDAPRSPRCARAPTSSTSDAARSSTTTRSSRRCATAPSPARASTSSPRSRCRAEHPYWTLDNVILTPHVSGYLPDFFARALRHLPRQPGALPRRPAAPQRRRQAAGLRPRLERRRERTRERTRIDVESPSHAALGHRRPRRLPAPRLRRAARVLEPVLHAPPGAGRHAAYHPHRQRSALRSAERRARRLAGDRRGGDARRWLVARCRRSESGPISASRRA